jgi:hypothetical protein
MNIENNSTILIDKTLKKNMFNRISKEIQDLYDVYDDIHIKYSKHESTHKITIYEDKNVYQFELNSGYPFRNPKSIHVNNRLYEKTIKLNIPSFIPYLNYYTGHNCLCCRSITSKHNWGPANTVYQIMKEIKKNMKIKETIVMQMILEKIKEKNNIPEHVYLIEEYLGHPYPE